MLLNDISYAYSVYQFDSAYHYARLAEAEGTAHKDTPVIARAYILQGSVASAQGNLAESIRKTEQALNLALAINDSTNLANAYNNLALVDMDAGDAQQALSRFHKSLDYTTDDTLGRVYTLNNIALLYYNSGDEAASEKYMAQAIAEAQVSDDPLVILEAYFTEGMIKMKDTTQLDSALLLFNKTLDISREYKDLTTEVHTLINIAIIHRDAKRTEHSESVLQQVISLCGENNYPLGAYYAMLELGDLYLDNKLYSKAWTTLKRIPADNAMALADQLLLHELKGRYYRETGQYRQALAEQDSVFFFKDSLSNTLKHQELTRLEVNYEVAQKNRAHEILALEKEQAEQKVVNQRRLALLAVFILVLLLFTSLFLLWQRRRFSQQLELQVELQTQELQKANQELEQSNQELERFTYIASHDLKEPLRNIISFTTLLERKKALWVDHEDARDFFSHIKRSARQMHTLIQDVLAYAQVRGGRDESALTRVDLNEIMAQIQEALQPQLEAKNAKLYSENLTFIEGTPHHFYIILKNLVENGLKYNEYESPRIIVRQALKTEKPRLMVIDNGIGIPDEFKPKVFDMFYRLHDRVQYEGTGLGLAIVHRLATSLDATLEISDRPGGGTIFTIQFTR
ncbi:MAG: tetratricopeptide repeat-containing sensor histidine kinase [Phaeodactylibacter sp.]|uniref:tetratricopeptide repeat-containing sensor histidine kinase n=1 Tax=Phaeodactylibacter sp. TaxID=1940289 RepID=UPI0032EB8CC0